MCQWHSRSGTPYGLAIFKRVVRLIFTWLVWSTVTTVAAAQSIAGAGPST